MRRSISELQQQFVAQGLPQINLYDNCQITQVLFPAHCFKINAAGYSGPSVVRADEALDFGTLLNPKVFRGGTCTVTRDQRTGEWLASKYQVGLACAPTTNPQPPNVNLPSYVPRFNTTPFVFPPLPSIPPWSPPAPIVIPPVPKPPPPPGPKPLGLGNLAYVSTHKGLAAVVGAYSYGTATGTNLLTAGGWTVGAGWSGTNPFAHSSGTATLVHSATITIALTYRVKFTVTGWTTGSFTVALGGVSLATQSATGYFDALAASTASLTITPTTGFDGTITFSMIDVTALLPTWTNLSATKITATTGTVTQSAFAMTGSGTHFTTECVVGERIVGVGIDETITVISSDTSMTVDTSTTVGVGVTFTLFRPLAGLVAGAPGSLVIRWFVVDPFSLVGNHFTAKWVMTDSGLYRVTGLPDAPVWTQQLTLAQANTVAGNPLSVFTAIGLTWNFITSARKAGFIATQLIAYTNSNITWQGYTIGDQISMTIYSLDYGVTWNCDNTKFIYYIGSLAGVSYKETIFLLASSHLDNVYFAGNADNSYGYPAGDQTSYGFGVYPHATLMRAPGNRATAFPDFSRGMSGESDGAGTNSSSRVTIPYCDNAGSPYPNDDRLYLYKYNIGTGAIKRFTSAFDPLWSAGYTLPTKVDIGDAAMSYIQWLSSNMWNEDYGVALDVSSLWFTSNLTGATPTWIHKQNPAIGSRILSPVNLFCVPADKSIVFFVGSRSSGGATSYGLPCLTTDFGATLIDISGQISANGIDAVMQLTDVADMNDSQIWIDFYYTGAIIPGGSAAGIDVSHWQGTMNWATAKSAGVTFAFIKASQGAAYTDPQYATNITGAGAQSISRGSTHFYVAGVDPTAQANYFFSVAASAHELGWAVDIEEIDDATPNNDTPANYKTFLDRMEVLTGQKITIYTRASYWNLYVGSQVWSTNYPLWIASWADTITLPTGWTAATYWQYTSSLLGSTFGAASSFIDGDRKV